MRLSRTSVRAVLVIAGTVLASGVLGVLLAAVVTLAADVSALRSQVFGLGETPVVGPPPEPLTGPEGPRGERGEAGQSIAGPRGGRGEPGQSVVGPSGAPGRDGRDGADSIVPGADGSPGRDGRDGVDGQDGQDGVDGEPGPAGGPGSTGPPGPAGQDGTSPSTVVCDPPSLPDRRQRCTAEPSPTPSP